MSEAYREEGEQPLRTAGRPRVSHRPRGLAGETGAVVPVDATIEIPDDALATGNEKKSLPDLDDTNSTLLDAEGAYLHNIGKTPLLNAEEEVELAQRIEAGLYASKLLSGEVEPTTEASRQALETEPELLEELVRQGEEAQQKYILANLRLVVSMAKKYFSSLRSMKFADVIQEGNLGLVHSVKKFDYTKGFKFSTYATWWIRQAISRGVAGQNREVRLPVHVHETSNKLRKVREEFERKHGREVTLAELSRVMKMAPEAIEELEATVRVTTGMLSLNKSVDENGETEFGDRVAGISDEAEYERILDEQVSDVVWHEFLESGGLTKKEISILFAYHGWYGEEPKTYQELGDMWGVSGERIRQIINAALQKVRENKAALKYYAQFIAR